MKSAKILIVSVIIFLIDQVTKVIIQHTMELYQSLPVLGNFFRITYVENSGIAFGIQLARSGFFTIFAVIASAAIMIYLFRIKREQIVARFSMALILGGAIGNVWDRIVRGSVVDFLDFEFFDIHLPPFKFLFIDFPGYSLDRWPVFNVADMGISIGMALLLVFILFEKEEQVVPIGESEMIR